MPSDNRPKRKAPKTAFKPGVCPNPGGRPKSSLRTALAAHGELRKNGKSNCQLLAEVAWKKALDGDLEWAKWLADRVDGKSPQAVDLTSGNKPVKFTLGLGDGDEA